MRRYDSARVLVTGATGLIGSALVRSLLRQGAAVHVFVFGEPEPESELVRSNDIDRTTRHVGRLEDPESVLAAVLAARPQVIFHLGAQPLVGIARADPVQTFATNVAGTWSLLEACRALDTAPVAIAVASSDKAYGTSEHLPYVETDPLRATEPYEVSKAMTDMLGRSYAEAYGLPVRIARCGNVYGPGDWNWSRIVPGTLRSLLRGERPIIRSDGSPIRDYIHVDDVVEAYLALGASEIRPGEAFNFSSGEILSVLELVALLQDAAQVPTEPDVRNEASGEIQAQYLDSSKARRELGWQPSRRLVESLPSVIPWYRDVLSAVTRSSR
jgi:CDP-glucose 4,6-dehydratase